MTEYQELYNFWFQTEIIPKFWFDKNTETDQYIITNYTDLLKKAENHELNHWKSTIKGHLCLIILLDQFSRHIYRNNSDKLYNNDIIAYHYAKEFIINKTDTELTNLEKMMLLMPFRHQNDVTSYEFVINYTKNENDPIWNKFKKHTLLNYEHLKEYNILPNRPIKQTIDFTKFNSVLENPWLPEMQTDNIACDLSATLIKFCIKNFAPKEENIDNLLIVSLSGGVDSMVILYILSILKKTFSSNLYVVAVHLDYHNRSETGLEAEFLFRWCSLVDIPLYYRYVHEGTRERNSKHREEYEELTKQIRFDMYTKVKNLHKKYNFMGVILGHHKGDLQENIFFNTMKGRSLIDLSVIKEQSDILGVKILRPLLSHPKSDIFEIAHKNNIPYFKNTTPEWSNRGQYREIIQPAIIKTFGEGVLTNLSKIGQESDELQLMIKTSIINPYMKTIKIIELGTAIHHYLLITPNQTFTYWKYILHEWCHINNMPLITHKLIKQIYEKICYGACTNISCNSKISMTLNDKFIIIKLL
jgi:tRNA(Ile)-lysidine synthetase-like protein